jgi:hypothetical protein
MEEDRMLMEDRAQESEFDIEEEGGEWRRRERRRRR